MFHETWQLRDHFPKSSLILKIIVYVKNDWRSNATIPPANQKIKDDLSAVCHLSCFVVHPVYSAIFFEGLLTGSGAGLLTGSGVKKLTESRVSVGRTAEFKCDIPEDQEIKNLTVRTAGFDCKQIRGVQRCEKWRLSIPGGITVPNATVAKHPLYLSKLKEG